MDYAYPVCSAYVWGNIVVLLDIHNQVAVGGYVVKFGESQYIHGLHEPGGEHLHKDKPGWILNTHELGHNPDNHAGCDYQQWTNQGFGIIARLNNGYGDVGTIPLKQFYVDFAKRTANFVAASPACGIFIIGNEMNHSQERPSGIPISADDYFNCFKQCYAEIKKARSDAQVLMGPVAPWNIETGDWLEYFESLLYLARQVDIIDGVALHAYTHGTDPSLIFKDDDIRHGWNWQFHIYRQQLGVAAKYALDVPIYITEVNPVEPGWLTANTGWYQNAVKDVNAWNEVNQCQVVRSVIAYRWPLRYDQPQYAIETRPGVQEDFKQAVALGYKWTSDTGNGDDNMGLQNPSYEPPAIAPPGYGNVLVAEFWKAWWSTTKWPEQDQDPNRLLVQPEYKVIDFPERVIHGHYAQCMFVQHKLMNAGVMQRVRVGKGAKARFTVPAQCWCSDSDNPLSDDWEMYGRVGIDVYGVEHPMISQDIPNAVWGAWTKLTCKYQLLYIEATALADYITVYTHFWNKYAPKHADAYIDNAILEYGIDPQPPTPTQPGKWNVDLHITGTIEFISD